MKLIFLDLISLGFLASILLFNISILKDALSSDSAASCKFCSIANYTKPEPVLYEDEQVMVLTVPSPRCDMHLIVIPREHIKHIHSFGITPSLLQSMKLACLKVTETTEVKMMFHNPPFYSVPHLHMHCMICSEEDDNPLLWNYWVNMFNEVAGISIEDAIGNIEDDLGYF